MNRALINSLGEQDRLLIAETETAELRDLDEDALITLHKLVRKRRDKYRSVYRRTGAQKVKKAGGRGKGKQKNKRNADRLEVFEDALSRVSRALATAARQSATELRTERIEAARAAKASAAPSTGPGANRGTASGDAGTGPSRRGATTRNSARKTPTSRKATASTRASGARRQAARDAR